MKTNNIFFSIILFLVYNNIEAQQDPSYIFYRYNMNLVNPAYAGAGDKTDLGLNLRSQWSGVSDAPETQSFFASTFMGKKVGLGASIINDRTFIERQTSIAVDFSYKVQWDRYTNIYFGLKASGNSYNANLDGLMTFGIQSDQSLMDIDGGFTPNIGAGVYYQDRKLTLSFSIPYLLKPNRLEQNDGLARLGRNKVHMYFMGAYKFEINKKLIFRPSTMLRYIEDSPASVDMTFALNYNKIFEFGGAYRLNEGFAGFLIFGLPRNFDIGYAYETSLDSALVNNNNGTHELFLKFSL